MNPVLKRLRDQAAQLDQLVEVSLALGYMACAGLLREKAIERRREADDLENLLGRGNGWLGALPSDRHSV